MTKPQTTTTTAPVRDLRAELVAQFAIARQVSVPLVGISTADQSATIELLKAEWDKHPIVQWDAVRGLTAVNSNGSDALAKAHIGSDDTIGFVEAMIASLMLPPRSIVFARNVQRQLQSAEPADKAQAVQAVANLRDRFKMDFRMLVMLAPTFVAPSELTHDVQTYADPLPTRADIATVIREVAASAKRPAPKGDELEHAIDAALGLPKFEAEQMVSLSLTKDGFDVDRLWERKRVAIEATKGMKVWRGGERFADLVGLDGIKSKLSTVIRGRTPVGVIVYIDEIDKVLANVESDTTNTRMYQLRSLLTKMEDNRWGGVVCMGVPGAGKSAIAKAMGNEAGCLTIALDLGETESKYVGESEENVRHMMRVIESIGGGHAFFIATSNNATIMRPELQRRFYEGMFFFDVMSADQRAAAWRLYMAKMGLPDQTIPDDDGWTGAEIRNCCFAAWNANTTLVEAARFIVPMARSRADEIEHLRRYAHGRFLDANGAGHYRYTEEPMAQQVRAIHVPGSEKVM